MPTAQEILRLAAEEIGTVEGPRSNEVKYNAWYYGRTVYGSNYAWCDVWISWLFDQEDALDLVHGKNAYTPTHVNRFKSAGQWHSGVAGIQPGDIVFYQFDGDPQVDHVEIVEKVGRYGLLTIGGNTAPDDAGSQSNGGGVYRRSRSFKNVVGYGRPAYQASSQGVRVFTERDKLVHNAIGRSVAMADAICKKLGVQPTDQPNTGTSDPLQAILEMVARTESNLFAIKQQVGA